ncbi:translation initiation factor IF-3 [Sinomonas albida]|uniref:translation initiation factor IF-3 n=1 Tax=Sinomonas albida TaxID=369942 RepID=UPI001F1D8AA5|nr:translation initiation factor IF-3 [Sinomonas albida]
MNISEPRINERIRVPEVRLVGPAGEQVGIVRIEDALRLAAESDLDLVEVAPQAKPPVCKLMDFGKYKYEAAVKAREARKNQTNTVLKEIRFRLKIDTHDYETKKGHALRFLGAGDKVKAMIQFRGREQQRPEMGIRLLQRFADDVAEVGAIESTPRIDGRNMVMVIGPLKNKAEAKAEARRAAQRASDKAKAEAAKAGGVTADNAPLTQSLGDALPADFLRAAGQTDEAAETEAAEVQSTEVEAPETETAEVETPEVEAEVAETAEVETAEAETPAAAAPKAQASKAQAPAAKAPAAKAPAAAPAKAPAAKAEAPAATASEPKQAATAKESAKPVPRPQAPRPAEAAKPAAPKPSAPRPQAPKPGAPRPGSSAPKPAAPRSSGRRGN